MAVPPPYRQAVSRRRLLAVAVAGVLGAIVVVGLATLAARGPESAVVTTSVARASSEPQQGRPPILLPPLVGQPQDPAQRVAWAERLAAQTPGVDAALRLASAQSASDDVAGAAATLAAALAAAPADPRLASAVALVGYDSAQPEASLAALRGLAEASPADLFTRFSYGVALLWAGRRADGEDQLRRVRDATPETFYGISADDLVHPGMPPGYPPFVPAVSSGGVTLAQLAAAAAAAPGAAAPQVAYAAALLAAGRRSEAAETFDTALQIDPGLLEAKVGRIIATYSKDNPPAAFGQMGPLVRDNPTSPSPRLHLALMLLWLRDPDTARAELRQAAAAAPGTRLGRAALQFLAALPA